MSPLSGAASVALASVSTSMLMKASCWLLHNAVCNEQHTQCLACFPWQGAHHMRSPRRADSRMREGVGCTGNCVSPLRKEPYKWACPRRRAHGRRWPP